jgi:hypothetical protein
MAQTEIMTLGEKLDLAVKSIELEKQGKEDEAQQVRRQIPMSPYLAMFAKEYLGAGFLKKYGWNLTEADAEYGPGWLNK